MTARSNVAQSAVDEVRALGAVRLGGTDLAYAPASCAGPWVFLSGHEATDHTRGYPPELHADRLPIGSGGTRHQREGAVILERMRFLLEEASSGFAQAVRIDQHYTTGKAVDGYQRARRAAMGSAIPPSTSAIIDALPVPGADIDVSLVAVRSGEVVTRISPQRVGVPSWSGFTPVVVARDLVFVAGQMADGSAGGLDPRAIVSPFNRWGNVPIRLQTEVVVKERLVPALDAAGSSLAHLAKAFVYLETVEDLPDFLDVWDDLVGLRRCALTIVPGARLNVVGGRVEINIVAVTSASAATREIIEVDIRPPAWTFGAPAVKAGDLLFFSGLLIADAQDGSGGTYPGARAYDQVSSLLELASEICDQAGTSLERIVRIQQLLPVMADYHAAVAPWRALLGGRPLPLSVLGVRAPLIVPRCAAMIDSWVFVPPRRA